MQNPCPVPGCQSAVWMFFSLGSFPALWQYWSWCVYKVPACLRKESLGNFYVFTQVLQKLNSYINKASMLTPSHSYFISGLFGGFIVSIRVTFGNLLRCFCFFSLLLRNVTYVQRSTGGKKTLYGLKDNYEHPYEEETLPAQPASKVHMESYIPFV